MVVLLISTTVKVNPTTEGLKIVDFWNFFLKIKVDDPPLSSKTHWKVSRTVILETLSLLETVLVPNEETSSCKP